MKWTDLFKGKSAPKASEATTQPVEDEPRFTFSEDGKSVRAEGLAALEQCSEGYDVGDGLVIRDHNWRTGGYGKMTYREAFIRKSDVAYCKAAAAYNKTDAKEARKMFCSKTTEGTGSILLRNVQGHPTTLIAQRW